MESAIWGLIGTVVGAAASLLATYLTNTHSAKLSTEARAEKRLEKFQEFQRESLLELQMAIREVERTTFLIHLEDSKGLLAGRNWGEGSVPDRLGEEDRIARSRVSIYVERVADASVRSTVKKMMSEVDIFMRATSKAVADHALTNIISGSAQANELIGKVLRDTY